MDAGAVEVVDGPRGRDSSERAWRLRPAITLLVAVLPAAALFLWHASCYGGWLIDDAGISFAYARNLAAGFGLVSQPGQVPVEGYSNPLWVLLIALLYSLKLFLIPFTPKLLSCACVLAALVVFSATVRLVTTDREAVIVAGMGLLLSAANPGFVIWCVSGLENPLLVLLAAALLWNCIRSLRTDLPSRERAPVYAGLLAAGIALTRPDGVMYGALFPLALLSSDERARLPRLIGRLLIYGLWMGVPFGAYLLFRHHYFHDWLPNTYYAKPGVSLSRVLDITQLSGAGFDSLGGLSQGIFPPLPLLVPLVLAAAVYFARNDRRVVLLAVFAAVPFVSYVALPPDWMGEYRFATVAFPGIYILGALLLYKAAAAVRVSARRPFLLLVALGCVGLLTSAADFLARIQVFAQSPALPLEAGATIAWKLNELAEKLALRRPTLLLPDLGGTLLLSKARIVDIAGLCDRNIGRVYYANRSPDEFARYVVQELKPDLVHIHSWWAYRSGLTRSREFAAVYVSLGDGNYVRRSSLPAGMDDATARSLGTQLAGPPSNAALRARLNSRLPDL